MTGLTVLCELYAVAGAVVELEASEAHIVLIALRRQQLQLVDEAARLLHDLVLLLARVIQRHAGAAPDTHINTC